MKGLFLITVAFSGLLADINAQNTTGSPGCYRIIDFNLNNTFDCCYKKPNSLKDPCIGHPCPLDRSCRVQSPSCSNLSNVGCDSTPQPFCGAHLSWVQCEEGCYEVFQSDGSRTCICDENFQDPCRVKICAPGYNCSLMQVQCNTQACNPVAQCRKICPARVRCPKGCFRYTDESGCQQCYCCNNCVNKRCRFDEECVLEQTCNTTPCPRPLARCVKKNSF